MRHVHSCVICAALLVACSRENPEHPKPSPGASTAPAAKNTQPAASENAAPAAATAKPADAGTAGSTGTVVVKKVVVLQEGTKTGIPATISRIAPDEKKSYFSATDDHGLSTPNQPCAPTDRFDAEPSLPVYLKTSPRLCAEILSFSVPSAQATYALVILGNEARKANDFATAQLYYSQAASRLQASNVAESLLLNNQAKISAGKALGVARPTVNVNGEEVFTAETLGKLRAFQTKKNIAVTNTLDPATARALAPVDESEVLRRALTVPPERVEAYKINPAVIHGSQIKETPEIARGLEPRYDLKAMTVVQKGKEATMAKAVKAGPTP